MSTNFNYQEQYPAEVSETRLTELFAGVMQRVYGWMSLGLLVTTVVAILTLSSPTILNLVFGNMIVFWGLVICELILVISVNRAISRLSSGAGLALFFVYAALNGVTLSVIFLAYGLGTIVFAFGTTTLIFIILTVVGLTTKEDLTKWGDPVCGFAGHHFGFCGEFLLCQHGAGLGNYLSGDFDLHGVDCV